MVTNSKNKDSIVATSIELFRRKGYGSVMGKDICQESGVSASSFYSVFRGKEDVLLCILRGHKDDFEGTMLEMLNAGTSLEKLWVLYNKYLKLAESFKLVFATAAVPVPAAPEKPAAEAAPETLPPPAAAPAPVPEPAAAEAAPAETPAA